MHPDDLYELLESQPFRPFRVILTNNAIHEIRHPEFAQLSRRLMKIGVPDSSENSQDQNYVGVTIVHIVKFEFLPPRAAS